MNEPYLGQRYETILAIIVIVVAAEAVLWILEKVGVLQ